MFPYFYLFGIEYSTYGFFTAIGIILMTVVALWLSKKTYIKIKDIILGEIVAFVSAFIGAHLLYIIVNAPQMILAINYYLSNNGTFDNYINIIFSWVNGMVFYGGLLSGLVGGLIYCKCRKLDLAAYSDCLVVGIPLFHCFGRIGCFFSGCCYGIESTFGFTSTNAIINSCNHVNRFPVQLLEAGLNLVLFSILILFFCKGILSGNLVFVYLILYSIIRFFDEFLRGDTYRGIWFDLSTSQWISIFVFIFSIIMLITKLKPSKNTIYKNKYM